MAVTEKSQNKLFKHFIFFQFPINENKYLKCLYVVQYFFYLLLKQVSTK